MILFGEEKKEQKIDFSKPFKVTKQYAKALSWTAEDYELDFAPEFLETQIAIADPNELEHLAQVAIRQLHRETENASDYYKAMRVLRNDLDRVAAIVDPYAVDPYVERF